MINLLMSRLLHPLMIDEGAPPPGGGPAPDTYTFSKIGDADPAPEDTAKITEFAKANKLSQEQAQAALGLYVSNKAPAAPKAPETYTFSKIKDADGKETDAPKEIADQVSAFAKENGLSQEHAQKLLDRELSLQSAADKQLVDEAKAMQAKWRDEVAKHPELSKGNLQENLGAAKKALETFFPNIAKESEQHAFLDHPEVVAGLFKIAQKIQPDGDIVISPNPGSEDAKFANMYPSMKK